MKKLKCVLSCFLCLALLLCVGLRPITAKANTGVLTEVMVGGGGAAAAVAPELIPIIVMLVGAGIVIDNWDAIVAKAEQIYNSASDSVKQWYASVYPKVIDGTSVFKIPVDVRNDFNEKTDSNNNIPAGLPFFFMPTDLLSLDKLTQEDVFAQTVSGAIQEGNELTAQSNNLLGSIRSFLGYAFEGLTSSISSLGDAISVQYGKIEDWFSKLNSNFDAELQQMKDLSFSINSNLKSELIQTKELVYSINTNFKSELQQLKDLSFSINNNVQRKFNELSATVTGAITTAVDNVGVKIDSVVTAINASAGSGSGGDDEETKKIVFGGINYAMPFFGFGKDYLVEYSTGFLVASMIFNEFADIPIINKLLFVSVTIGIIGVVLGIALNVAQSDKSARGKKSKAGVT